MGLSNDDIKYLTAQNFKALIYWSMLFVVCGTTLIELRDDSILVKLLFSHVLSPVMIYSVHRCYTVWGWNKCLRKQTYGQLRKWLDKHK